jgi:LacI family transcriptional regulator
MAAPPARKPTIKDVAQRAGASIAAVSYAINGNRFVSEQLSGRIRKAIEDLDYTPSKMAQSLRRNRTQTIGLIMDDITNRFGALFTKGLESAAVEQQYTLIISDLHGSPANEPRSINLLLDQRVDGIIYCGFGAEEARLREIHASGLPVVMADKPPQSKGLPSVVIDNRAGVLAALKHLRGLGHKDIVFINGEKINRNGQLRADAFREFMIGHGLDFREDQIVYGDYTLEHGFQAATRVFERRRRFTAVFCGDDMIAFGVLAGLKARGLRIPEDVAVVGFGDDPISRVFDPSLTTIHYPMEEMGRQAFARFRKLIGQKRARPQSLLLETSLRVRRSTDPGYRDDLNLDG